MKKLTVILAAFALTFGFSQCKKAETPATDEGVRITLTAGYGNGAKTGFNPETGAFTWTGTTENPEYINVGGSTHGYLGQLTSTQSGETVTFSGTITPSDGETLYFFYLGKGNHASATSVDFSNQDGTLANVTNYHIAISNGIVYNGQTSFSATLNMAMSIAYFDVNGFKNASETAETVYLHGDEVYSTATINYREGTITGDAKGNINLGTATAGKYVALIPSVSTETTLKFDSDSKWGAMNFMRGIQAGRYYSNSGAALTVTAGTLLEGTAPGLFSVSATKKVRFSQGNLQYIGSAATPYWKFADNQWDVLGTTTGQNSSDQNVDRDLFGWGTSGNNHGAGCYQPWSTSQFNDDYYAYGQSTYNLYEQTGQADWGYNPISNGGNTTNTWRTLTGGDNGEWQYIFDSRSTPSGIRYAKAQVNGVKGVILLPDDWSASYYSLNNTNQNNASFDSNVISSTQWSTLEQHGAVFLPAAGYRYGKGVNDVGSIGNYWSASCSGNAYSVYFGYNEHFGGYSLNPQRSSPRCGGQSVRLVRNVQ